MPAANLLLGQVLILIDKVLHHSESGYLRDSCMFYIASRPLNFAGEALCVLPVPRLGNGAGN